MSIEQWDAMFSSVEACLKRIAECTAVVFGAQDGGRLPLTLNVGGKDSWLVQETRAVSGPTQDRYKLAEWQDWVNYVLVGLRERYALSVSALGPSNALRRHLSALSPRVFVEHHHHHAVADGSSLVLVDVSDSPDESAIVKRLTIARAHFVSPNDGVCDVS